MITSFKKISVFGGYDYRATSRGVTYNVVSYVRNRSNRLKTILTPGVVRNNEPNEVLIEIFAGKSLLNQLKIYQLFKFVEFLIFHLYRWQNSSDYQRY